MKSYRKIWIDANGPIPFDEYGRRFEIHHVNGNHSDNRLENLKCVSIQEHYNIHHSQGDYQAAAVIARRMMVSAEKQTHLNRLAGKQAYEKKTGFHAFPPELKSIYSSKGGKAHRGRKWWTNGIINVRQNESPGANWSLGRTVQGTGVKPGTVLGTFWNNGVENRRSINCPGSNWTRGKLLNDTQRSRRSEIAKRPKTADQKKRISESLSGRPQPKVSCPHCNKSGGAGAMTRFHFHNCKQR